MDARVFASGGCSDDDANKIKNESTAMDDCLPSEYVLECMSQHSDGKAMKIFSLALYRRSIRDVNGDDDILRYLTELSKHYCVVFVGVATDHCVFPHPREPLSFRDERVSPDNCKVWESPNSFLDFGIHWRLLRPLLSVVLGRGGRDIHVDALGIGNDSVVCLRELAPLYSWSREYLPELLRESPGLVHRDTYAWGVTKSYETDVHLQSFFIETVGDTATKALLEFVNDHDLCVYHGKRKRDLVTALEIGLSQHLMRKRHIPICAPYDAYFLVKKIPQRMSSFLLPGSKTGANPAYSMWDRMLILGCPFVKKVRHTYEGDAEFIEGIRGTQSFIPRR